MEQNLPIIALIGPPNAGKSSLFNKIVGHRPAVTSDVAGTTRDRQYQDSTWNGVDFTLVDTAGILRKTEGELEQNMAKQIDFAIKQADLLILVMDGRETPSVLDQEVLRQLRKTKTKKLLAVNKLEAIKGREERLGQFQVLGIKPMFGISALNGSGIGDMLDEMVKNLPKKNAGDDLPVAGIAVSIVGKPNVGKSSIFNKILKEERVVVSPVPGTTRAAIDSHIKINNVDYTFIDTAGLKKKEFRQEQPDVFSGFQTFKSIRRSDVCFLVIDATEEITKQDQRIAQEISVLEKGCIILVNKVDLYKGTEEKLKDYISSHFQFLWMCPVFFVSGKTGQGIDEAIAAIAPIYERRHKTIEEDVLKDFLAKALKKNPPQLIRDQKQPKVFGLNQTDTNPPRFELYVNHPAAISTQFRKFLENSIIRLLDFYGTPIVFKLRGKDKK